MPSRRIARRRISNTIWPASTTLPTGLRCSSILSKSESRALQVDRQAYLSINRKPIRALQEAGSSHQVLRREAFIEAPIDGRAALSPHRIDLVWT